MILIEDFWMKYILMKDILKNKFIFKKEQKNMISLFFKQNKENIRNFLKLETSKVLF